MNKILPLSLLAASSLVAAPIIDDFSNLSHVKAQNSSELSLALNSGDLEATRLQAGYTGFYWNLGPTVNPWDPGASAQALSLQTADQQFILEFNSLSTIEAAGLDSPSWAVWVFLYDTNGDLIPGEQQLQINTSSTGDFSFDIQAWTAGLAPQYQTAVKWTPMIQVISNDVGDGYSFEGIAAVPEPSVSAMMAAGFAVGWLLIFRRRHSAC